MAMGGMGWVALIRRWSPALVALTVMALLGGCSREQPKDGGNVSIDKDHPLALFLDDDLSLIDYAQLKLQNQCLAKAGYTQNLNNMPSRPYAIFDGLIITPRTFGPTSEQEARRIGFGRDQPPEPPSIVSYDANYDQALDECARQAWQRLGNTAQKVHQAYFDLGNKLLEPLMKTIESRLSPQMPAKMLACIRGKGYRVDDEQAFLKTPDPRLLGVPFGDPDPGAGASWKPNKMPGTVQVGPGSPAREYHASPEEGALAVAWFQCRQETKLAEQQMAVAVEVQNELVTRYETSFDELNPQIKRIAKQAAALIGKQ
jgi:hypothetical protein